LEESEKTINPDNPWPRPACQTRLPDGGQVAGRPDYLAIRLYTWNMRQGGQGGPACPVKRSFVFVSPG